MSFFPAAQDISRNAYTQAHFGGNVLATNDRFGEEGTTDESFALLEMDFARYPGGSLTEDCFCILNADSKTGIDRDTGEEAELVPISEMFSFAKAEGVALSLVIPTRIFIGEETDANGDRLADVDEALLRDFISAVADGTFGPPPAIQAFELGNEYWNSGRMNAIEYARVSTEMARIIDDEMANGPNPDLYAGTDLLVQMGMNYGYSDLSERFEGTSEEQLAAVNETYGLALSGEDFIYSSGEVAWAKVNNAIIVNEFDTAEERATIDGVIAHVYSKGEDIPNSRYFELSQIDDTWLEEMPGLKTYVTEWNLKRTVNETRDEEFGLKQAHEMLNVVEAFDWAGVNAAHVWPVHLNARTSLANESDGGLRVPGEMFRLMDDALPGTRPLTLAGSEGRETEIEGETADLHSFYAEDRLVTFIASNGGPATEETVDFNSLVSDAGEVFITRLGVAEGEDPTASVATPDVTSEDSGALFGAGVLTATLAPYEILMVEMFDPVYTEDVQAIAAQQGPDEDEREISGSIASPNGVPLGGMTARFRPFDDSSAPTETSTTASGNFTLGVGPYVGGRLDASREREEDDPDITVSDALDVLRLAVGLEPSWGPAEGINHVAADIDQDGTVSVSDALDVLRAAVGLASEAEPRWVAFDAGSDFSGQTAQSVDMETGVDIAPLTESQTVDMTTILLGNMEAYT